MTHVSSGEDRLRILVWLERKDSFPLVYNLPLHVSICLLRTKEILIYSKKERGWFGDVCERSNAIGRTHVILFHTIESHFMKLFSFDINELICAWTLHKYMKNDKTEI